MREAKQAPPENAQEPHTAVSLPRPIHFPVCAYTASGGRQEALRATDSQPPGANESGRVLARVTGTLATFPSFPTHGPPNDRDGAAPRFPYPGIRILGPCLRAVTPRHWESTFCLIPLRPLPIPDHAVVPAI